MKQKTVWLKMKVTLKFDETVPEYDLCDFLKDIASGVGVDRKQYSSVGSITAKSDRVNVIH